MARYEPSDPRDYLAAIDFLNTARKLGFQVELKKYHPRRSNRQNNYYHFICAYFAHQYGCTEYEAENVYMKQFAAPHIFEVEHTDKDGRKVHFFRSSADLDTAEMSSAIQNFLAYAELNGIMIPYENDDASRRICEREIEKTKSYGT